MQKEAHALYDDAVFLSYFMRGSIQLKDTWEMTPYERDSVRRFLEKRLKDESDKKTGNKVY